MSLQSRKRSAPSDFEDAERPSKMPRTSDILPAALAPAQSSSALPEIANDHHVSAPRSAKRKLEQQDATSESLPSKKIRLSPNGDEVKRSLPGLRGGSTRRRQEVVGDDGEGSSSTPARETAAQSAEKNESESTSSSPKPAKDHEGGNANTEPTSSSPEPTLAPDSGNNNHSSEPTSSSPKPTTDAEGGETNYTEPTSSSSKPTTDTECGENNDREPTSSSPQPEDSSTTSTNNAIEPTKESKEATIGPSEALGAERTTSESSVPIKGSKIQASEYSAMFETKLVKKPQRHVNGLVNNSNQCFANSAIQFFDAALENHNLDVVLGEVEDTGFEDPMLTPFDCFFEPRKNRRNTKQTAESKASKVKREIRDRINKMRRSGKMKAISPRRHVRALLHRMRQPKGEGRSEWVTPYVFQQVLAHGDKSADRGHLDGMEQEDSCEYFQAILSGVKGNPTANASDEESDAKSAIIDSLFDFRSETATVCSNEACEHRSMVESAVNNAHVVNVPTRKKKNVMDLVAESNVSEFDQSCPNCGTKTLERRTEFKEVADNFVVHINRTSFGKNTKRKTPVELPLEPIELCGKKYVLDAVIRHIGDSANTGHYTILRRRSQGWHQAPNSLWYLFNDDQISAIPKTQVKDHWDHGQSSLLLFKAQ